MKSADTVRRAFALREQGWTQAAIAAELGVSRRTVGSWLKAGEARLTAKRELNDRCPYECPLRLSVPHAEYAYLLGQYLGDGWIATFPRGVYRLGIACCAAYPGIVDECGQAIQAVAPLNKVFRCARQGVTQVECYSKHWPCLFPQCGPGPKHLRPIVLESWQDQIALVEQPQRFLRGLLHSDGWRGMNPVRGANGRRYSYPRYNFTNHSADIRRLFIDACEVVGVEWKQIINATCRSTGGPASSCSTPLWDRSIDRLTRRVPLR